MRAIENKVAPQSDIVNIRAWHALGLWFRAIVIGAGAVVVGVVSLWSGLGSAGWDLAMLLGGGALALLGWQRIGVALKRLDTPESNADAGRQNSGRYRKSDSRIGLTEAAIE